VGRGSLSLLVVLLVTPHVFLWMGDLSQAEVACGQPNSEKKERSPSNLIFLVNKFQKCTYSDTKNITQDNAAM
jgi:hypothetical protein